MMTTSALITLIVATVIDIGAVVIAFIDFLRKGTDEK